MENILKIKAQYSKREKYNYHIFFWIAFYVFFLFSNPQENGISFSLIKEFINVVFFAAFVYFNLYYLIPNYLNKNHLLSYFIAMIFTAMMITPIKTLAYYFLYERSPSIQSYFIDKQFSIFLSSLFVGIGSTIYKIVNDWIIDQGEKQELQKRSLESELNFLKSQINPHFLFNTLNNLYALTLKKSDKAPEIVLKLSEMMRYMLYECNEMRVPLFKEINYIKNYLQLEELRQGKHIDIHFDLDGDIHQQMIAPLMFIPFLENCFKHGLKNQIGKGYVNINMIIKPLLVKTKIVNSKSHAVPAAPRHKKSGGIGLLNVKKRLELHYPNKHELTIFDNPNEFIIKLNINL